MTRLNGTEIGDTPSAHTQRVFVAHDSLDQARSFARQNNIPKERIDRLLHEACDADNYTHDIWRAPLYDLVFEFHLSRFRADLRSISPKKVS